MPAPISEDARQICFWLPVHMVKWLKAQEANASKNNLPPHLEGFFIYDRSEL